MAAPARHLEPVRQPDRPARRAPSARPGPGGRGATAPAPRPRPRRLADPSSPARAPKQAPPRPQLRVVGPRVRRRRAGVLAAAVCGFTFVVMLGLTVFQARIAAEQMRIEQIDRDIADQQAIYTRLRLAVAQAQTPEAAAARAQADGLALPAKGIAAYVTPTLEDVLAVVATGAAGPANASPTVVAAAAGANGAKAAAAGSTVPSSNPSSNQPNAQGAP